MSANDAIVLKANFEDWKQRIDDISGVDAWLYYCVEQFVKTYALDDEEIMYGLTDGGNDGGADAIYFLVNQRQLVLEDSVLDAKNVSKVKLIIIQCKKSGGFKPTEIEKWLELTDDFLALSKPADSFGARYNNKVVRVMRTWKDKYIKVSSGFPDVSIEFLYITGDDVVADPYAIDSGERVKSRVAKHVNANCSVRYIGAKELWEQVQRRPPKSKTLIWAEQPMQTVEGYVGLARLKDFFDFIQDEPGVLAERIFESNVRGYQVDAIVNTQIQESLKNVSSKANFWLLNNGVTIITPQATPASHLHLSINDPQIVNGLQTSREIFTYCSDASKFNPQQDKRTVLVRVIQTDEPDLQDMIIRATNSQNRMLPASLRMTDQIHRNIEELFKKVDLYYDRRKGFYRDQSKQIRKIVSANDVVQAVVSIMLQRPDDARGRPGDYFKDDSNYARVFADDKITLDAYLSCVEIVRRVERFFDSRSLEGGLRRNLKFYVAAFLTRESTKLPKPVSATLPSFSEIAKIDDKEIDACYKRVKRAFDTLAKDSDGDTVARGPELLKRLDVQYKRRAKSFL
ncbi:MAG: AIPR family protein [Methylocystis sp.]|nr:AIPR family protein [Methylocystis sp.]